MEENQTAMVDFCIWFLVPYYQIVTQTQDLQMLHIKIYVVSAIALNYAIYVCNVPMHSSCNTDRISRFFVSYGR